jgi:methylated-DNA-[protein]-cysteine S-methyltransferase
MSVATSVEAVAAARERLALRARREGLEAVGYDVMDSPVGRLWIAMGPKGVATIHFGAEPDHGELRRLIRLYGPGIVPDRKRTSVLARELDQYFEGRRRTFDLPVDLDGLTAFHRRVLRALTRVPYGGLTTYQRIAREAGNVLAPRAAGRAVGANPIPIVVPCHRVIASDGTLGGYGGGLDAKRALLALERGTAPEGGWPKRRERPS